MNETLVLADNTVLAGHCIESGDTLWLYLDDTTLADTYPEISDPDKTKLINADRYGVISTYTGYTHLFCIREEGDGSVSAGLKKQ